MGYGEEFAKAMLSNGITKLSPDKPFVWASGYQMPIYNDNRMLLAKPDWRRRICYALTNLKLEEKVDPDIIAGTATAGIPHATTLADMLEKPLIYIREKPKDHGMNNRIEGISDDSGLNGKNILVIEDLVSTGGSSAKAIAAVREAGGICTHCFSIFSYGLNQADEMFAGTRSYDEKDAAKPVLSPPCTLRSVLTYDTLIRVAKEEGAINADQEAMLQEWRADPFNWGAKHGFPPVKK